MSRIRLNIYLEPEHARQLAELAVLKRLPKSMIVGAALASAFSPDAAAQREAAISRLLDRLTRQFDKLEQDHNVAIETLALFIRYFLSVTPIVPADQQEAARAQGRARFEQFVEQLARHLQKGKSLVRELHEQIYPEERDFFVIDDLAANEATAEHT
jgi:hypothetical protein